MGTLSPTAVKAFNHCKKQYHEVRVLKKYPYEQTPEALLGDKMHSALEKAVKQEEDLPTDYKYYSPIVNELLKMKADGWTILCEYTLGVKKSGEGYSGRKDVWWAKDMLLAGKGDVVMVKDDQFIIIDYKTGNSRYPDLDQLDAYAMLVFANYPHILRGTAVLLWLLDDCKRNTKSYTRGDYPALWHKWETEYDKIQKAFETGAFEHSSYSPLCGWCPCSDCPNWAQGQEYKANRKNKRKK